MEITTIPKEDLRFMLVLDKPTNKWIDGKFIFHSLITVLLLGLCCYFITPVLFMFSGYVLMLNIVFLPLIWAAPYDLSAYYLKIFWFIEKVNVPFSLGYIFVSLIEMEVARNIAEINNETMELALKNRITELIIIFLSMAVTTINLKYFKRVVKNKKEEICPKLIISWKKDEDNQSEQGNHPKYEDIEGFDNLFCYQQDHDNQANIA